MERERKGKKGEGREREGKGGEGRGGEVHTTGHGSLMNVRGIRGR